MVVVHEIFGLNDTIKGVKLDEVLASADIPHNIKVYPGAKRSFTNGRGR